MTVAALLLALAVLVAPAGGRSRSRPDHGAPGRPHRRTADDPIAVAAALDVLAVCLTSGLAVAGAADATAASAPPGLAAVLRRAAGLLALGADPAAAWQADPDTRGAAAASSCVDALARLARRSASSGTALADGVAELARQIRADAADSARAAAERVSVLIAAPLGLCFLPAFVCLGVVPVVAGLASDVLGSALP